MMRTSTLATLTLLAGGTLLASLAHAAGAAKPFAVPDAGGLLLAGASQGYLGVGLMDVDADRASALKLKEARGAEIITLDQDAPAAKSGLKIHDVVTQMNGQAIEGIEQFRRMLREIPPGRGVSLVAMREGQAITLNVQLADRATIAKNSMIGLDDPSQGRTDDAANNTPVSVPGGSSGKRPSSHGSSFLAPFGHNRNYVGVDLQPLPSGLAEYFGVHGGPGLLVGNVFPNSPGAAAGLKAADVIQKVNGRPIVSLSDWERAIHTNRGKQVQVTIIRDKREQTLSMIAGEAKNTSRIEVPPSGVPRASALIAVA